MTSNGNTPPIVKTKLQPQTIQTKLNICSTCCSFLLPESSSNRKPPPPPPPSTKPTTTTTTQWCSICLGLVSSPIISSQILQSIREQLKPFQEDDVSNCEMNISLPSDILIRSHSAICYLGERCNVSTTTTTTAEDVVRRVKDALKSQLLPPSTIKTKHEEPPCGGGTITVETTISAGENTPFPQTLLRPLLNDGDHHHRNSNQHHRKRGRSPHPPQTSRTNLQNAITSPLGTRKSTRDSFADWITSTTTPSPSPATYTIRIRRAPLYLRGNYLKLKRNISQTPFFVEGSLNTDVAPTSVSDLLLTPFQTAFQTLGVKFHASGREDINVRMLHRGRPFGLEIVDARIVLSREQLKDVVEEIHRSALETGVDLSEEDGVVYASSTSFQSLQSETEDKVKHYGCICWTQTPFSESQLHDALIGNNAFPLEISQKTPIRVLHRRADMNRSRYVLRMDAIWRNEHWFELRMSTSAGTYVKEFVHGDLGRTCPSVKEMLGGGKVDILQLDVLKIEMGEEEEMKIGGEDVVMKNGEEDVEMKMPAKEL